MLFSDEELIIEGNSTHDNVCQYNPQLAHRRQQMVIQEQMEIIRGCMRANYATLQRVLRNVFSWFKKT